VRVLITGASGFIGRKIISRLVQYNIDIVPVGRKKDFSLGDSFIEADLLDSNKHYEIIQRAKATHLVHFAWYAEHGEYWNSSLNLRWVESTVHLVQTFCKAGGKYVSVAGTSAEYDWSKGYLFEDDSALNPVTLYGVSKDAARRLIASVCDLYSIPWMWGRIFIPYGPGEDVRRLIPSLRRVFQHKQDPFGVNANSYRDFVHVEDVASAFVYLINAQARGCFNISSGVPTLVADLVGNIASLYKSDPNLVLSLRTERPAEPEFIIGNNDKLKSLGWRPRYSLFQSLVYET
jgi:nucleoside-diphosphate-sugar epimerase